MNFFTFRSAGDNKLIGDIPVHGYKEQFHPIEASNIHCYVLLRDIERLSRITGDEPWICSQIGYTISARMRDMTGTKDEVLTNFERRTRPKRMDIISTIGTSYSGPSMLEEDLADIQHG